MKFKAAILRKTGQHLEIEEIEIKNKLKSGQVLVKIEKAGICGAQINEIDAVKGTDNFLPHLLGHEGYGEIIDTGPDVKEFNSGDKVVLHWMKNPTLESETPIYYDSVGRKVNAGWVTTFNEFAIVSVNRCTKVVLPKSLDSISALFGCAITTAFGNILNDGNFKLGQKMLLVGAGGVGLFTVQFAKAAGATEICAVDLNDENLSYARQFGATSILKVSANETEEELIKKLTPFQSYDLFLDMTGKSKIINSIYNIANSNSKIVLVGVPNFEDKIQIDSLKLHFGLRLTGSKGGDIIPSKAIMDILNLYENGVISLDKYPIQNVGFTEINLGLDMLRKGVSGRIIVNF